MKIRLNCKEIWPAGPGTEPRGSRISVKLRPDVGYLIVKVISLSSAPIRRQLAPVHAPVQGLRTGFNIVPISDREHAMEWSYDPEVR